MPLHILLYRTLKLDDDGDPMDHGLLLAKNKYGIDQQWEVAEMLRKRFAELGHGSLEVKLYPLASRVTPGILADDGYSFTIHVNVEDAPEED